MSKTKETLVYDLRQLAWTLMEIHERASDPLQKARTLGYLQGMKFTIINLSDDPEIADLANGLHGIWMAELSGERE